MRSLVLDALLQAGLGLRPASDSGGEGHSRTHGPRVTVYLAQAVATKRKRHRARQIGRAASRPRAQRVSGPPPGRSNSKRFRRRDLGAQAAVGRACMRLCTCVATEGPARAFEVVRRLRARETSPAPGMTVRDRQAAPR